MENRLLARLRKPFAFKIYQLWKLPTAWFWGLKIVHADEDRCVIGLPFGWFSQNPFRSIYFAALTGAGEMSTGLLALAALDGQPPVSMLVTEVRAEFFKKAADFTLFTCEEGPKIRQTIQTALETNKPQTITMTSEGRSKSSGELVCRVQITWSFKKKKL